jgi:molybdopterin-guanine dinucleotide biosynthesis protein A
MQTAGYVLAGGASSRMGRDKAFLMFGGRRLIDIAAAAVCEAAGSVTIVGPPGILEGSGWPVIPDRRPGAGPLAGIETALNHTTADWNLIVACDMPRLNSGTLRAILAEALANADAGCVMPESATGRVEPLCAAYHKRSLSAMTAALDAGRRKVTSALPGRSIHYIRMIDDPIFQNVNTPEEWGEARRALES